MAFDFSFEAERTREEHRFARREDTAEQIVTYALAGGVVTVDPWPFGDDDFSGFIVGYRREGYPEQLKPLLVPYTIRPAT